MRDFSKISPAVWHSQRFINLASDDGRYLYLYFLTSEHRNSAGCYRLPDSYASGDLQWQQDRYLKARKQLVEADLIHFDEENHVVMICRWFKHNPPMNEKHFIGIECILERLTSPSIREAALATLNEVVETHEAEKAAKAQRKLKPMQGPADSLQGAMPERLQTPFMAKRR
jgi:hypothetical protein